VRSVVQSAAIFLAAGLGGPLLRWIVPIGPTSSSVSNFVYNLVLLLWPAQLLAVIEVNTGRLVAVIISVGTNLALFAVVGVATGICARKPLVLISIYLGVCGGVGALAVWAFGLPFTCADTTALACSLVLYAIPFIIVFRRASCLGSVKATPPPAR
jgi:hypothetical protein